MLIQSMKMPMATAQTQAAASLCLQHINQVATDYANLPSSPASLLHKAIKHIGDTKHKNAAIWVINQNSVTGQQETAWPIWFNSQETYEKPLFYFVNTPLIEQLSALETETNHKGIFLNCIDTGESYLPKGVYPWFPLKLASMENWLAYDIANAQEAAAIAQQALTQLYLNGNKLLVYMALHSVHQTTEPLSEDEAIAAFKGMYPLSRSVPKIDIQLCGAGKSLERVKLAAQLLKTQWGIESAVWSCPSYTRLAFDAKQQFASSHLNRCLGNAKVPVIAVTDYSHHIAKQIKPFIPRGFMALGSDSIDKNGIIYPSVNWIVLCALKQLYEANQISVAMYEEAIEKLTY
ncbi:transketolase-like TK C-terminal-containing protein [Providencia vermicola]|uniref:transketolase-like TK C-terminal-containing protein n=1 Tax=Providencia vermicola TaxID=333965 RepID=UPI001CED08DB|nr:pyruvate dehydrogenase (lipoamide) [Providencia vermicola]